MEDAEDVGGDRTNGRSPPAAPPEQRDYWEDEERIRSLLELCFNDGVYPTDLNPGEMPVQGREAKFKLNNSLDEIKIKWLKERTVSVIFKENARFLPRRIKDDTIRAFEDGWVLGNDRFPLESRSCRVKIEGPNALSYVARTREVAKFMLSEEDDRTFWVIAVQVPLDDMPFIYAQIERAVGRIILAHPPDVDPSRPALVNSRFDVDPEARGNMKDKLWIITSKGDELEVKLACASTPKCRICKQFFHVDTECRRGGGQQSSTQTGTGRQRERRPSYSVPLGPCPSQNANGGNPPVGIPAGATSTNNPVFSPNAPQQPSSTFNMMQLAAALYGAPAMGPNLQLGGNWMQQAQLFGSLNGGLPFQGVNMGAGGFGMAGPSAFQRYQPGQVPWAAQP
ncbi:hypothetical protein CBR_g41542 [Chara braunii]|uniref:Uncharacterized protein n=1 Tax=Chara braunii TaxID=69332 RepID=A0A388K2R0_CHABU|nr:hypothetical protein CBR_g41542 [Chara braunii]|eukprot:GBG64341.1 hypothetical protein CBR_g41542 [Chara braunii]